MPHFRHLTVIVAALFVGTTLGVVSGTSQINSYLNTVVRAQGGLPSLSPKESTGHLLPLSGSSRRAAAEHKDHLRPTLEIFVRDEKQERAPGQSYFNFVPYKEWFTFDIPSHWERESLRTRNLDINEFEVGWSDKKDYRSEVRGLEPGPYISGQYSFLLGRTSLPLVQFKKFVKDPKKNIGWYLDPMKREQEADMRQTEISPEFFEDAFKSQKLPKSVKMIKKWEIEKAEEVKLGGKKAIRIIADSRETTPKGVKGAGEINPEMFGSDGILRQHYHIYLLPSKERDRKKSRGNPQYIYVLKFEAPKPIFDTARERFFDPIVASFRYLPETPKDLGLTSTVRVTKTEVFDNRAYIEWVSEGPNGESVPRFGAVCWWPTTDTTQKECEASNHLSHSQGTLLSGITMPLSRIGSYTFDVAAADNTDGTNAIRSETFQFPAALIPAQ